MQTLNTKPNYNATIYACFIGYVVQAIVNNFAPLLFLTFQDSYDIPLTKITLLVTFNFGLQLIIDLISAYFVDKIGYRTSMLIAHGCVATGLVLLTILPEMLPDPFIGLLLAIVVYAVGGGLLEVLVSPIVEACPTDNKEAAMSLLHSFYCWGHVGVVLLSTVFFAVVGISYWKILALIWAIVPIANGIAFTRVPIAPLMEDGEQGMSIKELFVTRVFWVMMIMMLCSGASEQAVSQWASALAEKGLGISKTLGDLLGPMMFAIFMGSSRAFYGKFGEKMDLRRFMIGSCVLCIMSYLLIGLMPGAISGLIGCAICGLSVGVMWPGTFSIASASIRRGGTVMFAFLALAGDVGCMSGPTLTGEMMSVLGGNMRLGILCGIGFPIVLLIMTHIKNADFE